MAVAPLHLRPFEEPDLVLLVRYATDPSFSSPFQWRGYQSPEESRRRWAEDAFLGRDPHQLVAADPEGAALGWVMWRDPHPFGRGGLVWEIGVVLAPEARGRGVGTAAQRRLVEHLFETTTVHRLCANVEVDNIAEQRCLERCGFHQEGLLREAGFRGGRWRDVVVYGLLRHEAVKPEQ